MAAPPLTAPTGAAAPLPSPARLPPRALLASLALGCLLSGFIGALFWSRAPAHAGATPAPPEKPAWQALEASNAACARQRPGQRIATGISPTFPIESSAMDGSIEVLVGASSGANVAVGLKLNATTLEASEVLREDGSRELLGVVPLAATAPPTFASDRASVGGFRDLRTLPHPMDLALARTNQGLHVVRRGERTQRLLWSLGAHEELGRPRVEWQAGQGWAVVLRRGGRHGTLLLGWLEHATLESSALRDLPFEGSEVGLPSLALREDQIAVVAALRASAEAPWRLQLTVSERQGPALRVALPTLHSHPDQDTFAPSLIALDESRWLLQWTEGEQGRRRVRALTLGSDFGALGEPIDLSDPGANAGGGQAVRVDQGALSLFLVQRGAAYDLHATPLSCI